MTPNIVAAPPDHTTIEAFHRDGYTIIRNAFTETDRRLLLDAAQDLLTSPITAGRDRGADGKDGFRGAVNLAPAFLPLITNSAVLPTIVALLSPNIHLLSSHLIALQSLPSDARRSVRTPQRPGWHRDMYGVTDDLGTSAIERQLLGQPDRAPDGSLAKGAGSAAIRDWWQTLNNT